MQVAAIAIDDHSFTGVLLVVCDLETSKMRQSKPKLCCGNTENKSL